MIERTGSCIISFPFFLSTLSFSSFHILKPLCKLQSRYFSISCAFYLFVTFIKTFWIYIMYTKTFLLSIENLLIVIILIIFHMNTISDLVILSKHFCLYYLFFRFIGNLNLLFIYDYVKPLAMPIDTEIQFVKFIW